MSDYDDSPPPSRSGGFLLMVATHGVALVLGAVLGVVGYLFFEYMDDPQAMSRPEGELSRPQLIARLDEAEKRYADLLAEKAKQEELSRDEFEKASAKVVDLEGQVSKKQDEVKVLELKVKRGRAKSAALEKELADKVAELESLQGELTEARAEQARLREDLQVSREETADARQETRVARGETVDARWVGFKSEVVLQVCEKGNRNRLAKCREEVKTMMDGKRAARYKHCVASGQATPRLVRVDPKEKDPDLPRWSEWMDEENSFTKEKWYLVFCDPTLPEAQIRDEDPDEVLLEDEEPL